MSIEIWIDIVEYRSILKSIEVYSRVQKYIEEDRSIMMRIEVY